MPPDPPSVARARLTRKAFGLRKILISYQTPVEALNNVYVYILLCILQMELIYILTLSVHLILEL